jgi:hypothetical protein
LRFRATLSTNYFALAGWSRITVSHQVLVKPAERLPISGHLKVTKRWQ